MLSIRCRPRARGDPVSFGRKTLDSRSVTKMSGAEGGLRASSRGRVIVSNARRSSTGVLDVLDLVELDVPRLAVDHLHFAQVDGLYRLPRRRVDRHRPSGTYPLHPLHRLD